MYRGKPVQPFAEAPRNMPEGTMPQVRGAEPPLTLEYMTAHETNPLRQTPENLEKGHQLYAVDCAPCHGDHGTGNGPVAHLLKERPADLVKGASKPLPDGYIYGAIRDGKGTMPSYADAMSAHERWQVVLYVRSLQNPAAPTASSK